MPEQRKRRLAAVCFADIVGYTDLSARDENAALEVVDELQRIAREEVESREGRIVKFQGDAVLTVFDSADAALRSALALRDGFTDSAVVQEHECGLRIGVHLGEVVEAEDGDVYGDGVNVASRIEGQADAGQVVVSEDVYRLLRQQADHGFHPFGPVALKGVEEPMWLYVVGAPEIAMPVTREASVPESTAVYNAVTRHWPKIVLGGIGAAVGAGFTFGRIEGVSFQSYVLAWAATTGGVWFMFDKAEAAMSARSRKQVVGWLRETELRTGIESIPAQFAVLFDRLFGAKHLSWQCFVRSSFASIAAAILVFALLASVNPNVLASLATSNPGAWNVIQAVVVVWVLSTAANWVPDYLSLFETRILLGYMRGSVWRISGLLVVDAGVTAAFSLAWVWAVFNYWVGGEFSALRITPASILLGTGGTGAAEVWGPVATVFFYSAFFTSVWLWLYVLAVLLSRVLLRMNNGVGFLLRVTDVERQPFRSMGFVSVIIVSALFALGLPLVWL